MDGRVGMEGLEFWRYVDIQDDADCWKYVGPLDKDGYGRFTVSRRYRVRSHRFAYAYVNGEIPKGMVVMHSCDNPACCNPRHLSLGTQADNVRDCRAKGRIRGGVLPGEANPNAKLTTAEVLVIKRDTRRQADIAADHGISGTLVSYIKSGRAWAHVGA